MQNCLWRIARGPSWIECELMEFASGMLFPAPGSNVSPCEGCDGTAEKVRLIDEAVAKMAAKEDGVLSFSGGRRCLACEDGAN